MMDIVVYHIFARGRSRDALGLIKAPPAHMIARVEPKSSDIWGRKGEFRRASDPDSADLSEEALLEVLIADPVRGGLQTVERIHGGAAPSTFQMRNL